MLILFTRGEFLTERKKKIEIGKIPLHKMCFFYIYRRSVLVVLYYLYILDFPKNRLFTIVIHNNKYLLIINLLSL